jgi:hypothetical protein
MRRHCANMVNDLGRIRSPQSPMRSRHQRIGAAGWSMVGSEESMRGARHRIGHCRPPMRCPGWSMVSRLDRIRYWREPMLGLGPPMRSRGSRIASSFPGVVARSLGAGCSRRAWRARASFGKHPTAPRQFQHLPPVSYHLQRMILALARRSWNLCSIIFAYAKLACAC